MCVKYNNNITSTLGRGAGGGGGGVGGRGDGVRGDGVRGEGRGLF